MEGIAACAVGALIFFFLRWIWQGIPLFIYAIGMSLFLAWAVPVVGKWMYDHGWLKWIPFI